MGGSWLLLSRLGIHGIAPIVFSDEIVLLTGLHFHFAGFTTTLIAGEVGHHMDYQYGFTRRLYQLLVIGVTVGTPIIALGITFNDGLALVGVSLLSTSLLGLALLFITASFPKLIKSQKELLLIGGGSLFVSMPLAILYSYGQLVDNELVGIPFMIFTHGLINCFGFAFCSLLAFRQALQTESQVTS